MRGKVVRDGLTGSDRRDRMLEDELIGTAHLDDDRETIEVLDVRLHLSPIEQANGDRGAFTPRVIEEYVLNVPQEQ